MERTSMNSTSNRASTSSTAAAENPSSIPTASEPQDIIMRGTASQQNNCGDVSSANQQQQQQQQYSKQYKNPVIFKTFDPKTGQFMRNQEHAPLNSSSSSSSAAAAGLALLSQQSKFRSHSVPIILHSSLRRLTADIRRQQQLQQQLQYAEEEEEEADEEQEEVEEGQFLADAASTSGPGPNTLFRTHISGSANLSSSSSASSLSSSPSPSAPSPGAIKKKKLLKTGLSTSSFNRVLSKKHRQGSHLKHSVLLNRSAEDTDHNTNSIALEQRIKLVQSTPNPIPLPPINLQCLKEIDLQEIVKNPQLRHDIVFDPLLQFRPNLDGERGIKKRQSSDNYWNDVENEIFVYLHKPEIFQYNNTRLVPLFDSLRDILLTMVPPKETSLINNVLDTELCIQALIKGSLQMSNFADWLAQLFKQHCAPMRDSWVDRMSNKFKEAETLNSLPKLIEGLRLIFQILEAMKLDIANHQIRILRPALLSNSVEFEKQYFQSLISANKLDIKTSLIWFRTNFDEAVSQNRIVRGGAAPRDIYKLCITSIMNLLSCRKMFRTYPTTLTFDHTRLVMLRADIRQIVCLLVCRLLFQQLIANDSQMSNATKDYILTHYSTLVLKRDIISIITDEHGSCRWTKNITSIVIHLCKTINDLKIEFLQKNNMDTSTISSTDIDNAKISFAKSWLSKQTQPLSEVYGVLENRVFRSLEDKILESSGCTVDGRVKEDFIYFCSSNNTDGRPETASSETMGVPQRTLQQASTTAAENKTNKGLFSATEMEEFANVHRHLYTVVTLHWLVFGKHYMKSLADSMAQTPDKISQF